MFSNVVLWTAGGETTRRGWCTHAGNGCFASARPLRRVQYGRTSITLPARRRSCRPVQKPGVSSNSPTESTRAVAAARLRLNFHCHGLLDALQEQQVRDLLAQLRSDG